MSRRLAAVAASWLATFLTALGYLLSNSVVVLRDFIHAFADSLGINLAAAAAHLVTRGIGKIFTHGFHRFGTVATFLNASTIAAGSIYPLYEVCTRLASKIHVEPIRIPPFRSPASRGRGAPGGPGAGPRPELMAPSAAPAFAPLRPVLKGRPAQPGAGWGQLSVRL